MKISFDLVIFGGTGDLSRRKLLPALFAGVQAGHIAPNTRFFLTSRQARPLAADDDAAGWLAGVFRDNPPACDYSPACLARFAAMVRFVPLEPSGTGEDWAALAGTLDTDGERTLVHFLAVPPALFTDVCAGLGRHGLNGSRARLVLEKPLGHDLASARAINDDVARVFDEGQVFRIDHYLGKEAVQNLLALRFSNLLFEEVWNNHSIDHIQITIAEDHGVRGRGGFYEGTGALRDMVQNHLLQLLCLVAMEPPAQMDAAGIREEKLKVLKSLQPLDGTLIDTQVVRGQYGAGASGGEAVPAYAADLGLDGESPTETFVALKTHIENWRWAGVPFYLRTGKRLPARFAEIAIQFKCVPHAALPSWKCRVNPNRFIIRLQPEDHLALRMMIKDHASTDEGLREVELNLDVASRDDVPRLGPYLRLIMDAAKGDQRLFVHRAEVEHAWAWIDRIIAHWQSGGNALKPYAAGTWGPYEAHDLLKRDGRDWFADI
ncbi:glucose-6-phosphate dehydrogenase [Eilatimonas milleporae]|uniref:Glucose-6-phosphate 1-dehydrogenase n=1 Tax=Eilatimonas milleporae TaxID=911205 RepID=A0A3M0CKY7_9PROT|nr:glucose-6-phosphate dehydrogenase [Eilatimonas milleporae]RMB07729.1 glucose-6-phosphate 1-dehydrogenase [Eilatimonas milleporae]